MGCSGNLSFYFPNSVLCFISQVKTSCLKLSLESPTVANSVFLFRCSHRSSPGLHNCANPPLGAFDSEPSIAREMIFLLQVSFLIGKSGMSSAFAVVYVYSSELFPTSVRTAAVGTCSTCGRFGAIVTPWISDQVGYFTEP